MNNALDGLLDKQEMRQKLLQMRELLQSTAVTRDDSAQVVELDQAKGGRLSPGRSLKMVRIGLKSPESKNFRTSPGCS